MPVYTYRCASCGVQFDQYRSFDEEPLVVCPECHERSLRKLIQPVGIVFKGSGFYVTDNRKLATSSSGSNGKSDSKTEAKSDSGSEGSTEKSKPKESSSD